MDQPLYQRYNVDNVFNRSVIAGLLYLLNHKITYEQTWQDNVTENVTVPFAYNFAHAKDQRFAQDNYTFFGRECFSDKFIDGKFDMLPRFALTYTGSGIDSQNITNRFIQAKHQVVKDNKIESYTAFLYSIPLTLNFELEGWIDNYDTAFKIEQKIYETFYKNQTFRVLYKGMSINCCAGFPESITTGEKVISYSFEQENQLKMNFNIAVECYYPSFDESKSIAADNVIENMAFDVTRVTVGSKMDRKIDLKLHPPKPVYSAGSDMEIEWDWSSNVSEVCTVILYYITDGKDKHIIDVPMMSKGSYTWRIPEGLSKLEQPTITYIPINDTVEIYRHPSVMVRSDIDGKVTDGCFTVTDGGEFSSEGYVQVSCESIDDNGNYKIYDGYIGKINSNRVLENVYLFENVKYQIPQEYWFTPMNSEPFSYETATVATPISVGISYPLDKQFFDEIHNILII